MVRTAAAAAAVTFILLSAAPAQARAVRCDRPPPAGQVSKNTPAETRLYAPERLAPLATGAGVRVAVVDSGVDAGHPQLRGRVDAGADLLHGGPDGREDCVGHGTGVASIIAARRVGASPFAGLAPDATIVPVRITEKQVGGGGAEAGPAEFAAAVDWASDPTRGAADVLNVSVVLHADDGRVRAAVARALARGVVVVAAAGNDGDSGRVGPAPYPAAYPGVIGVGAITAGGVRAVFSRRGAHVDLAAAGDGVTVAAPRSGHTVRQGTSFAAPFVAATAALLRQRFPGLTPAQVWLRLVATADPAPGGGRSDEYGYGLLNPYRALTETIGPAVPPRPPVGVGHSVDPAVAARQRRRDAAWDRALVVGAAGAGVGVLGGVVAAAVRRGRGRGWRPPVT